MYLKRTLYFFPLFESKKNFQYIWPGIVGEINVEGEEEDSLSYYPFFGLISNDGQNARVGGIRHS